MTITNYQVYPQFPSSDGGGSSGLVLIDSGTIASPAPFLDIPLPVGYGKFRFEFWSLLFSDTDLFAGSFSFNDGVAYLNAHDSYDGLGVATSTSTETVTPGDSVLFDIAKINVGASLLPMRGVIGIYPGTATELASAHGEFFGTWSPYDQYQAVDAWSFVNPNADVTPTPARATNFRITPDGNGDVNPPTSGVNIVSCSWILFGIATS